jgi:hypothetical protein
MILVKSAILRSVDCFQSTGGEPAHSLDAEKTAFGTNLPLGSFRCPRSLRSEPSFTAS